jgi:hypothetical protein
MSRIPISKIDDFLLGSAIEIIATFNIENPTVTITIEDNYDTTRIDDVAMTKLSSTAYKYIFQSDEDWIEGDYIITIKATDGTYTTYTQYFITLWEMES